MDPVQITNVKMFCLEKAVAIKHIPGKEETDVIALAKTFETYIFDEEPKQSPSPLKKV